MSKQQDFLRQNPKLTLWLGYGLCVAGLLVAAIALFPRVFFDYGILPIFIGAFLYLPGSMLLFFFAPRKDRSKHFMYVRLVRLGFLFLIGVTITRILTSPS